MAKVKVSNGKAKNENHGESTISTLASEALMTSLFLSKIDRSLIVARPQDLIHNPLSSEGKSVLSYFNARHKRGLQKWRKDFLRPIQEIDGEKDLRYLQSLDPVEWKEQDHYRVLGLGHLRERAKESEIKQAYKIRVLRHHPDKRLAAGEAVNPEGDYFACIVKANEVLSNPARRREYDSVDPTFDNYVPSKKCGSSDEFFTVYGKWFNLNSRWSNKKSIPLLGNMLSSRAQVEAFYDFWFEFDSWREFAYLDEESKEKGECREERKWIERQNKVERLRRRKEEMTRLRSVVEAAYSLDPRVPLIKEMVKQEKTERKLARKAARKEKEAVQMENELCEKMQSEKDKFLKEEMERKEIEEKEKAETAKKAKEAQRKILKKERANLRSLCKSNNNYGSNEKEALCNLIKVEGLCSMLPVEEISKLNTSLSRSGFQEGKLEFEKAIANMQVNSKGLARKENQEENSKDQQKDKDKTESFTDDDWNLEESQILVKAVNLFPAGTNQRWEQIASYLNEHVKMENVKRKPRSAKETIAKAKELSKSAVKAETNERAYEVFEKSKKGSKSVVDEKISTTGSNENSAASASAAKEMIGLISGNSSESSLSSSSSSKLIWTADEQKLLEQALKTFPPSVTDRWEKIAESVPGRSKKECVARFKELAAIVKAKKSATEPRQNS